MHRLGISIYPTQSDLEMMKDYIDNSVRYGFKRIFTNLLSVKQEEREIFEKFKEIVKYANKNDMEVIADINREVFKDLQIDNLDLAFSINWEFLEFELIQVFSTRSSKNDS